MINKLKSLFVVFAVLGTCLFSTWAMSIEKTDSKQEVGKQSKERKTLRFLMQNSHPKYLSQGGEISGLCGEIYVALKERMAKQGIDVEIFPELFPIKRILVMLKEEQGDVFCGAGRNEKREKIYNYSNKPVYVVSKVVAARLEDKYNPGSFSELAKSGSLVGVLQGTSSAAFLKSQAGVLVDDSFHSLDQALEALVKHKALRYFYYHDLGLNYQVKVSGLKLRVVPTKLRSTPHWFIYSKSTPDKLQKALEKEVNTMISSGDMALISRKYLEVKQ